MVGDQEQQGENRAGISPELSDMTFLNSTRSREPGRGANRKHAPDRRTVVQRNCMNVFAAMGVFAISLVIVSGQSSGLCPEKMYAPPESGQDSYDDCICSPGAVTRDWEDEACTFYKLEKDRACRQDSLDWVYLDSADSPAQCMHLVMDDGSSCRRQDFFLWRVRGDKSCYCPGGSGPAAVDQCTYPVLYLMDASTYTIESAFVQGGKPENGSHLTSCFNLTALSLCELCPAGTFTNETDSIYSTDVCTPCPAGSYSSLIGANASSFCMPCGRGNYSEQTGMVSIDSCMACPGGTYSPVLVVDSRSKCISCASGYYSEQVGAISNDTCVQCPMGSHNEETGANSSTYCIGCIAGKYSEQIAANLSEYCISCIAGTYSEQIGANTSLACLHCSAGKYSEKLAANSTAVCLDCPAGSYNEQLASNSSTACIPCAAGLYSSNISADSSSTCVPCNAGSYSEKTGLNSSTLCTLCVAGKFSSELAANNRSTCIDCDAGWYSEQEGANSSYTCVMCPAGNYSETVGAWSIELCLPCPAFSYSPVGSNNLTHCICNQGYTGPNGQECDACIAGTYKVANGSQACTLCDRGKYSTGIGKISQDTCIQCLDNTFSGLGSSHLTNCTCNVGFTGPDGANCTACVPGTYKDVNGSVVCSLCVRGKYSSETAKSSETTCTLCPQNTFTPNEGSIVVKNCTCNMGFTGPDGVECTACIPGTFKDVNGTANCTACARGKYSEEFEDIGDTTNASRALAIAQALAYHQCLEKNLQEGTLEQCQTLLRPPGCTLCPNHTFSAEGSGNRTMCVCNQGYTGPDGMACDACIAGTYKDVNGSQACTLCQRGKYSTGIAIMRNDSCIPCPDSSFSALGSDNITDCLCNAGWEGEDGGSCSACAAGTFKSINGTWNCTEACVNKTACFNVTWTIEISGLAHGFLDQLVFIQYSSSADIIVIKGISTSGCTHKVNDPPNWRSSGNATCSDYVTNGWCSGNSFGPNWQSSYGVFADYADTNGVDAGQACCECGGGQLKLSSSYKSINVTAPAYISEVRYKRMNCTNSTASCNQAEFLGCGISFYTNRGETFAFEGSNYDSSLVCHTEVSWTASAGHMITSIIYDFTQRNVTGVVQALLPPEPCGAKVNCTKNCIGVTNCTVCEAGKYSDRNGSAATSCISCPLNTFSPDRSKNVTFCNCNEGYTGPDGTACISCELTRTYKTTRGSSPCSNCTQEVCETGFFRPHCNITTDGVCQSCSNAPDFAVYTSHGEPYFKENCNWTCDKKGGYISSAKNGSFCSVRGRERVCFSHDTTCVKCDKNCSKAFFSKDCECEPCSEVGGSWPPVNSDYSSLWHVEGIPSCGWQCKSGLSSAKCADPGNGLCYLPCPVGTYGDANVACQACPAGKSTPSLLSGSSSNMSKASNATQVDDCVECTPGTYKPGVGTLRCETRESSSLEACMLSGTCSATCPSACAALDGGLAVCCRAFVDITKDVCQGLLCVPCPTGSYTDESGAASCKKCPQDAVSVLGSHNITDCLCAPGFEGADGGTCTNCPAGKYKASAGTTGGVCVACEAGKYAPRNASTVCLLCGSGSISVAGSVSCTGDQVNFQFSVSLAMNASSFSVVLAQYAASIADLAGVSLSNVFVVTILNSSSPAASRRLLADSSSISVVWGIRTPRFHLPVLKASIANALVSRLSQIGPPPTLYDVKEDCGSGQEPVGVACAACTKGKYKYMADNSSCVACRNGSTTIKVASLFESDCLCEAGYFLNVSSGTCTPCRAGTFKLLGSGDCVECARGTYSPGTSTLWTSAACLYCPVDSYRSPRGSKSRDDCCGQACVCDAGYEAGQCDDCFECVACAVGYYKTARGSSACRLCENGSFTNASSAATSCSLCPETTYNDIAGASVCKSCPPSTSGTVVGSKTILDCKCTFSATTSCRGCPVGQYGRGPSDREVATFMPKGWSHSNIVAKAPYGTTTINTSVFQPNDIDMRYPLPGNIAIITNTGNGQVLYINISTGDITPVTWGGHGFAIGEANVARFSYPHSAAASPDGRMILVAGNGTHRVFKIDWLYRNVSVFAGPAAELGSGSGLDGIRDGNTSFARFKYPCGIVFHPDGNRVFVSSQTEESIRLIDIAANQVSTIYKGVSVNKITINKDGSMLAFTGSVAEWGSVIRTLDLTSPGGPVYECYNWPTSVGSEREQCENGNLLDDPFHYHYKGGDSNDTVCGHVSCKCCRALPVSYPVRNVAGKGTGYQDGIGTDAKFNQPWGITLTPDGRTAFLRELGNYAIRSVDMKTGAVNTVVGSGTTQGVSPNPSDGFGQAARFIGGEAGITLTPDGSMLLVTEPGSNRIRTVQMGLCAACPPHSSSTEGSVSCTCDAGYSGLGTSSAPCTICPAGNYVNASTRSCTPCSANTSSSVIGASSAAVCVACPGNTSAPAGSTACRCIAGFSGPAGGPCTMCPANFYHPGFGGNCSRCPANSISPAGSKNIGDCLCRAGTYRDKGKVSTLADGFNAPFGVAVTKDGGTVIVADYHDDKIKLVSLTTGQVSTLAGGGDTDDGIGTNAKIFRPTGVALSPNGSTVVVAEYGRHMIRLIDFSSRKVTTLAGSTTPGSQDGVGATAGFKNCSAVVVTPDGGTVVVADISNNLIRQIDISTGVVSTLAGSTSGGSQDGFGTNAGFLSPSGVALTSDGVTLVVAASGNPMIRLVDRATGKVSTLVGSSSNGPYGVALTPDGSTIVVAYRFSHVIRLINFASGAVSTLAGSGSAASQDGVGIMANLNEPSGLAVTSDGATVVVADSGNNKIRLVSLGQCDQCSAGKYSNATGAVSVNTCVNCPPNTFSRTGTTPCVAVMPYTVAHTPPEYNSSYSFAGVMNDDNLKWLTPDRQGETYANGGDPTFFFVLDLEASKEVQKLVIRNGGLGPAYVVYNFSISMSPDSATENFGEEVTGRFDKQEFSLQHVTVGLTGRYLKFKCVTYGYYSAGLTYLALI